MHFSLFMLLWRSNLEWCNWHTILRRDREGKVEEIAAILTFCFNWSVRCGQGNKASGRHQNFSDNTRVKGCHRPWE